MENRDKYLEKDYINPLDVSEEVSEKLLNIGKNKEIACLAMGIVNYINEENGVGVDQRQATNDKLFDMVEKTLERLVIKEWVIPHMERSFVGVYVAKDGTIKKESL